MGRNHHRNFYSYMLDNDTEYLINRVDAFINNCEISVVKYSKIRAGLCNQSYKVDYDLYRSKARYPYYIKEGKKDIALKISMLKKERKELSRAINKLDLYMQTMIDYSYLM